MVKVYLLKRADSPIWHMRWIDATGKEYRQTTGAVKKVDAKSVAFQKQVELESKTRVGVFGWDVFRDRYVAEVLAGKSAAHQSKFSNAANKLEIMFQPVLVTDITSETIGEFARRLRVGRNAGGKPLSETTIDSYLGYLKRAFEWASRPSVGLLDVPPFIERSAIAIEDSAKGRPLKQTEFQAMLDATENVVGRTAAESFRFLLRGLFYSGLRLGEALNLHWPGVSDSNDKIVVSINKDSVTLSIPAQSQKQRKKIVYPVSPEFAKFLRMVPLPLRVGQVFNPVRIDGERLVTMDRVSERISEIGREANVVVKHYATGSVKYASAQDLRRTFGLRWAARVNSLTLKTLMRHRNIRTTETYYAIFDATEIAEKLEREFGEV